MTDTVTLAGRVIGLPLNARAVLAARQKLPASAYSHLFTADGGDGAPADKAAQVEAFLEVQIAAPDILYAWVPGAFAGREEMNALWDGLSMAEWDAATLQIAIALGAAMNGARPTQAAGSAARTRRRP